MRMPTLLVPTALVATVLTVAAVSITAQRQAPSPGGQAVAATPPGNAENGKKVYGKYGCAGCHGLEGQGAPTTGPRLGPNPLPFAAFARFVRTPPNQMPPYTDKVLSEQDLRDMHAFLQSRPRPAPQAVLPD